MEEMFFEQFGYNILRPFVHYVKFVGSEKTRKKIELIKTVIEEIVFLEEYECMFSKANSAICNQKNNRKLRNLYASQYAKTNSAEKTNNGTIQQN